MKNVSSLTLDDISRELSFVDNQPMPDKPIQGLLQYLDFLASQQNYTNDQYFQIQDDLSR